MSLNSQIRRCSETLVFGTHADSVVRGPGDKASRTVLSISPHIIGVGVSAPARVAKSGSHPSELAAQTRDGNGPRALG